MTTGAPRGRRFASESSGDLETFHAAWRSKLTEPQRKIVDVVIANFPHAAEKEDVASAAGFTVGGYFNNLLGSLRTLGIITKKGPVGATDLLFPPSLMVPA